MEEVVKALELKNLLDSLRPIDKEQEARIMQKFRLDWNYHSNNLEGNSLTYGETKALIMFGITAQGKPLKDHSEIKGHNEAIDWVIEMVKGDRPLTESFIRELHRLLLNELYEEKLKKGIKTESYKTTPNHVITQTGETFFFATPEETPAKMGDLMAWYNEKIEDISFNPILLAAEFHYKFIRIHPFDDGNGRTARILMNFILMKFGYPPVIIKTDDKANYFTALQLADTGNLEAFVNYIAKNLNRSLEIMIAGAKGESIEEPDDIDKEIALLEKRLKGIGESSNVGKTEESLSQLFNNVMLKLNDSILKRTGRLIDYYLDNELLFEFLEIPDEWFSPDEMLISRLFTSSGVTMKIKFYKFTVIGMGEFNYSLEFDYFLSETHYTLATVEDGLQKFIYKKPYGIDLTDDEINEIALNEVKRHKDFIEQKIIEKEKSE